MPKDPHSGGDTASPLPSPSSPHPLLRYWQDTGAFGLATLLGGVFNYFFSVVAAHGLGPDRFGQLVAYLTVTSLLLIVSPVIALVYTRMGRRRRGLMEPMLLWGGGLLLWLGTAALQSMVSGFLQVSRAGLLAFTLAVVPALALAANTGLLQRRRAYVRVGFLNAGSAAAGLLAAVVALARQVPLPVWGLMASLVTWCTWAASAAMVRHLSESGGARSTRLALGTALVAVLWIMFTLTDTLMARHNLASGTAGLYIGLVTIGQSIPFFSGTFGTVMLTSILQEPGGARQYLLRALSLYAALSALGLILFTLAGRLIVALVLGSSFTPVIGYLVPYGWAMSVLGFVNLFLLFSVAVRNWWMLAAAGAGYASWVAVLFSSTTMTGFVWGTVWVATATGLVVSALAWSALKSRRAPEPV